MNKKRELFLMVAGIVLLAFGILMRPLSSEFSVAIITGIISIIIGVALWALQRK